MKKNAVPLAAAVLMLTGCAFFDPAPPGWEEDAAPPAEAGTSEPEPSSGSDEDSDENSGGKPGPSDEGGGSEEDSEASEDGQLSPLPSPSAFDEDKNYSDRGNLVKLPGERAGISYDDGSVAIEFTVEDIEVDPDCTNEDAEEPVNGHFVALDASVAIYDGLPFSFTGWSALDQDGETVTSNPLTGAARSCMLPEDSIKQEFVPGQVEQASLAALFSGADSSGKLVLDVADPEGILLLVVGGSDQGWEWNYPVD